MSGILFACWLAAIPTGAIPATPPEGESKWLSDYGTALRQAKSEKVPLLVVLENPPSGASVTQISGAKGIAETLLERYKLCRIDVSTEYGKKVAAAFGVRQFPHTVIIDKTASVQLFKKTGEFSADQWRATLAGFQRGIRRVVLRTRWVQPEAQCFT